MLHTIVDHTVRPVALSQVWGLWTTNVMARVQQVELQTVEGSPLGHVFHQGVLNQKLCGWIDVVFMEVVEMLPLQLRVDVTCHRLHVGQVWAGGAILTWRLVALLSPVVPLDSLGTWRHS